MTPQDIEFLTLFLTFLSGCCSFIGAFLLGLLVRRMIQVWHETSGQGFTRPMVNRAFALMVICGLAFGFFALRLFMITQTGKDLDPSLFLLFGFGSSIFMLITSLFGIILVEEIEKRLLNH